MDVESERARGKGTCRANQSKWVQNGRRGSMKGKRPTHWQRRKSRSVLSQGRERRENKVFGVRKREERTKQWEIKS